jgi:putative addiction module component (TIGR02574 family)
MEKVESLERDILALFPEELARLRSWYKDFDWDAWAERQADVVRREQAVLSVSQGSRDLASSRTTNILSVLVTLPPGDRIDLAQALWDTLRSSEIDALCPLTPEQEAEIQRRIEDAVKNPDSLIPWEEARERILAKLGQRAPKGSAEPSDSPRIVASDVRSGNH